MHEAELILIRHAESAPEQALPEHSWPLSAAGRDQADRLVTTLADCGISSIYSSPYKRALHTVQPLAEKLGLTISIDDALRERKLSGEMIANWKSLLRQSWQDFDFVLPGGESARDCQRRMKGCLETIAKNSHGKTIALSSHGNAIALFLNSIDDSFGYDAWRSMRNPHIFRLKYSVTGWGPFA